MKWMPKQWYLKLGEAFSNRHPIFGITPIACAALSIEAKLQDWDTIKRYADEVIAPSYAMGEAMLRNGLSKEKLRILPHSIPKRTYPQPKPHQASCASTTSAESTTTRHTHHAQGI
jgi:hypothetical protein